MSSPAQPVSLVVGAGPAGILSAVYLARRGHEVHLFEKRPSPLVCDSSDHRAFFVVLQPRGAAALEAAGFHLRPVGGLQQAAAIARVQGQRRRQFVRFQKPRLMGPRHAFVRQMVEQAEAMQLPNLHFHFETAFEAVDLASRTATFRTGSAATPEGSSASAAGSSGDDNGGSISFQYDLLVAADGGWSRVRRAAEAQTPELQVTLEQSEGRYKVFRNLPASPAMPLGSGSSSSSAPTTDGKSSGGSKAAPLMVLASTGAGGFPSPAIMFVGREADSPAGAVCGMLAMGEAAWAGVQSSEDCQAFLAQQFPSLPAEWLPEIAAQLEPAPLAVAGMRVHASQLHARSLVLLGDAGHGVTPRTGNGMNAAFEDAAILDQVLESTGEDLAGVPAAYTSARLPDAQALLWLDGNAAERNGTSSWGRLHPLAVASNASFVYRSLLSKATGGWVHPGAIISMNELCLPFREVKAQVSRDNLLLGTLGLPAAVPFALLAAAAVSTDRLRA